MSLKTRAIDIWSSLIVNLIHAYDPERVIVGGGVMAGEAEFFSELERLVLSSRAYALGSGCHRPQ